MNKKVNQAGKCFFATFGMIATVVLVGVPSAFSKSTHSEMCSFLPANKLSIPATTPSVLHEGDFNSALAMVTQAWSSSIHEKGKELFVQSAWNDERVNAYATRDDDDNPVIVAPGGLARHPLMTRDALVAVFCHEVGHFLGGAPKAKRGNTDLLSWSSTEGAADYFAAAKCLRKVFAEDQPRAVEAARVAATVFASIKGSMVLPRPESKDSSVVAETMDGHSSPQCRLDTFIAGLKCEVSYGVPMDDRDPAAGACVQGLGARPLCWYRPVL